MFDLQYGVFDVRQIQMSFFGMTDKRALLQRGSLQAVPTPLVRIPESTHDNPQFAVKQLLDIGAFGIMFPHIESKEQAEQAIRSMRYPQRAGVSFDPADAVRSLPADAFWYWGLSKEEYMRRADVWPMNPAGELLAVLQIESAAGVEHRNEIMSVPGVGAIFLGPSHLSQSLGERSASSPKTEEAVQTVLRTCLAQRIPCAYPIVAETADTGKAELTRRQSEGFRILTVNVNR
jgi:4-hydroxy-2-oxoheptanedioate aldolase